MTGGKVLPGDDKKGLEVTGGKVLPGDDKKGLEGSGGKVLPGDGGEKQKPIKVNISIFVSTYIKVKIILNVG